jgi:hypothetical protein
MATGKETIFIHYPNDYMWTGNGPRHFEKFISLPQNLFTGTPQVMAALATVDSSAGANLRVNVKVDLVSNNYFRVTIETWADTKLAMIAVSWMAYHS